MKNPLVYGIVGNGRLARHLLHWFALKGIATQHWYRRGAMADQPPSQVLNAATTIILAINDDAIEPFIQENPGLEKFQLIHCSGSLVTPLAFGAHLLQTFGEALWPLASYEAIPLILDEAGPPTAQLFPSFENPVARIKAEDKAKYHALCVLACSGTQLLWQKIQLNFDELGLDPVLAKPLLQESAQAVLINPNLTLTGPFVRDDRQTIERNLEALGEDDFAEVYRAFLGLFHGNQRPPRDASG
jgi:hypothetical protein